MVDYETKINDGEMLYFYQQLLPFGYADIREAFLTLKRYNININEFAQYVEDYTKDTKTPLIDVDICACAYEYVLQQINDTIRAETGTDIIEQFEIYTYSNYMCSSYDNTEQTIQYLEQHPELLENESIKKFYEELI